MAFEIRVSVVSVFCPLVVPQGQALVTTAPLWQLLELQAQIQGAKTASIPSVLTLLK